LVFRPAEHSGIAVIRLPRRCGHHDLLEASFEPRDERGFRPGL
jgi:hypothetical protein